MAAKTNDEVSTANNCLFTNSDGSPIMFFMRPCQERVELRQIIENAGGKVTSKSTQECVKLAEKGCTVTREGYVTTKYIRDCVANNKLLEQDMYRVQPGTTLKDTDSEASFGSFNSEDSLSPAHTIQTIAHNIKGRMKYTPEEDIAIITYLIENNKYHEASGKRVWKEMEHRKVTSHTSESMSTRYRKLILPQIQKYRGLVKDSWLKRLAGSDPGNKEFSCEALFPDNKKQPSKPTTTSTTTTTGRVIPPLQFEVLKQREGLTNDTKSKYFVGKKNKKTDTNIDSATVVSVYKQLSKGNKSCDSQDLSVIVDKSAQPIVSGEKNSSNTDNQSNYETSPSTELEVENESNPRDENGLESRCDHMESSCPSNPTMETCSKKNPRLNSMQQKENNCGKDGGRIIDSSASTVASSNHNSDNTHALEDDSFDELDFGTQELAYTDIKGTDSSRACSTPLKKRTSVRQRNKLTNNKENKNSSTIDRDMVTPDFETYMEENCNMEREPSLSQPLNEVVSDNNTNIPTSLESNSMDSEDSMDKFLLDNVKQLKRTGISESNKRVTRSSGDIHDGPANNIRVQSSSKNAKDQSADVDVEQSAAIISRNESAGKNARVQIAANNTKDQSAANNASDRSAANNVREQSEANKTRDQSVANNARDQSASKIARDPSSVNTVREQNAAIISRDRNTASNAREQSTDSNVIDQSGTYNEREQCAAKNSREQSVASNALSQEDDDFDSQLINVATQKPHYRKRLRSSQKNEVEVVNKKKLTENPKQKNKGSGTTISGDSIQDVNDCIQTCKSLAAQCGMPYKSVHRALYQNSGDVQKTLNWLKFGHHSPDGPAWTDSDDELLLTKSGISNRYLKGKYGKEDMLDRIKFLGGQ